jgi:predicted phage tail protein
LIDFRRVALHEFGHVLGLNHPDQAGQTVSSVMRSNTGDIDRLQPDDIAGVQALYSGTAPTPVPASAPGAPSSLVVSATGSSVSLSWRGPTTGSTPSTYVVEAGATPGAANLANVTTGSTSTSFSATGVGAGVYYVRVKARNSVGTSGASNEATLIVGGGSGPCSGAPSAPGALFVTGNSGGTVSFSWSASSGSPTTYIIEAGSTPGTANLANSDLGGPATTFTASGVGRGTYYVRLRAKNACGTSGVSNEVTLIVP